jgi:hypothetical protein
MKAQHPFGEVGHFLIIQRLHSMLAELPPAVQTEEGLWQPPVYGERFFVLGKLGVSLAESLLQRLEGADTLLPVLNQETAESFTVVATSWSAEAR